MEPNDSSISAPRSAGGRRFRSRAWLSGEPKRAEAGGEDDWDSPPAVRPPVCPGTSPRSDSPRDAYLTALLTEEAELARRVETARYGDGDVSVPVESLLRLLEVRGTVVRTLVWASQEDVREALEAGASWAQIVNARGVSPSQAREDFLQWIHAQAALWDSGAGMGLSPSQRTVARAFAKRS